MKKISLLILAVILCCSVFAKQKKQPKKKKVTNTITSVLIFRTGCFGQCPTYTVLIDDNGWATYTAIRFNADTGAYLKEIGVAKAKEILNEVNSYKPDTCKDVYDNLATDLPGLNFTIKYTTKTKMIRNAKFGPGFLQTLGAHIEAVGKKSAENGSGWQKVNNQPGRPGK